MKRPPYSMRWLCKCSDKDRAIIKDICLRKDMGGEENVKALQGAIGRGDMAHVMTLRGLLAFGLLPELMSRRVRVDYGLREQSNIWKKRLAVPYRACDTPSPRAEYSHPETMVILTTLSYVKYGIPCKWFKESVREMLLKGEAEQMRVWKDEWLLGVSDEMPMVSALDPTNEAQMDRLHKVLGRRCGAVVQFLIQCVFPQDMVVHQYEHASSAQDLAKRTAVRAAGIDEVDPQLGGTDGMMLHHIVGHAEDTIVRVGNRVKDVLDTFVRGKYDALLDAGGLLAGMGMREAARYVLKGAGKDVLFFDVEMREWYILEPSGAAVARSAAPGRDARCVVLYDQARCRGTDLKLGMRARGLLTISSGVCKDEAVG